MTNSCGKAGHRSQTHAQTFTSSYRSCKCAPPRSRKCTGKQSPFGYVHRLYMRARTQTRRLLCTAAICSDNRWLPTDDVSGGNTYKGEAEMWKERERCRRTREGERTGGRWKGEDEGGREGLKGTVGDEKEWGDGAASGCFQAAGGLANLRVALAGAECVNPPVPGPL